MKITKDSKGFSLVELIIVVAIITVISGAAIMGAGSIMGFKARGCSEKIITYLNETKTNSLGFDDVRLKLYFDTNEYKCDVVNQKYQYSFDGDGKITSKNLVDDGSVTYGIGDKSLKITYTLSGDSTEYDLKSSNISIGFERTSGSFKTVYKNNADTGKYLKEIKITQNAKTITIKCVELSGKFYIE